MKNHHTKALFASTTLLIFGSLAISLNAAPLLQIDTQSGLGTRIQFTPVLGASTTNTTDLSVDPNSGPYFGNALGQVALANFFTSPVDLDWDKDAFRAI